MNQYNPRAVFAVTSLLIGCSGTDGSNGWVTASGGGAAQGGSSLGATAAGASQTVGGATSQGTAIGPSVVGGAANTSAVTATGGTMATGGSSQMGGATVSTNTSAGGTSAAGGTSSSGGKSTGGTSAIGGVSSRGGTTGTSTFTVAVGKPTVYLAGDSTVQTYATNAAGQQGWGQRLQEFFTTDVVVVNRAIGGRSSKSYIDEGRLTEILTVIKKGDYLFAQWGINDRYTSDPARYTNPATTFRTYLKQYIDGARNKNAIPILVTPTPRHQYVSGVFENGFADYCAAIKAVGTETNTPVIDLQSKGLAYYTKVGDAYVTSTIALDALHFKTEGALQMARLVAQGVSELNLPISPFVIQSKL